jgi:hypothetical protein
VYESDGSTRSDEAVVWIGEEGEASNDHADPDAERIGESGSYPSGMALGPVTGHVEHVNRVVGG